MSFNYTANIPVSGQSLNVTKNPINSNFQAINQLVAVNHVGFNLTGLGKHNMCELVAQTTVPPATLVGEDTIYSKTTAGVTDIFYTADAGGNEYQLTRSDDARFATFGATPDGWTMLPGGLIMNYGQGTIRNTPQVITFSKPYTTALIAISAIRHQTTDTVLGVTAEGLAGFTMNTDGNASSTQIFYWISIGK